ncbi:uncharacterized protein LOC117513974 [Thalassophryne amazonica]|uniref:uncharacterized protein LOC117513974 n=1 Tax=Thalassophryne amazonica TaxID=390379 RepID=UPI0014717B8A|nr:uncharacterized protein LOC117513974 [Thalassophryne amazonica]
MNVVPNRTMRDDEAAVVEKAIRLAIDSIINVLYGVNSARTHEYQRMVLDRDREIQRLEGRLREIEQELQLLRAQGCTCGLFEMEHSLVGPQSSREPQKGAQSNAGPDTAAGQQECEMSITLGLFGRPPSQVSSQSHESVLPSSPSRMGLEQTCMSHSSEASGVSEATRNLPTSPSSLMVKEEPRDHEKVLIKWEMNEESFKLRQESEDCYDKESSTVTSKPENEAKRLQDKPCAGPGGNLVTEGEHPRSKKKNVPMSELPEEAQRQKRAAWRAASRRYYARKVARQKGKPSHSATFPHSTDSESMCFLDKSKTTLISELPAESQSLQREAWRVASRRYYTRKLSRFQTEPAQYGQMLQITEPFGDTNGGPSQTSGGGIGGILCS